MTHQNQSENHSISSNQLGEEDVSKLLKRVDDEIARLIREDPFLQHLPENVQTQELKDQVDLANGRAWRIFIQREDGQSYGIIVDINSKVRDLKQSFQRHFSLCQKRANYSFVDSNKKISWRYIWRTYNLSFDGEELVNDGALIKNYGIHNKAVLFFKKRRKNKFR